MSENTEYKLYDSYAKSEPDVKSETNSVPIGSGVVLLASLAFAYQKSKVKSQKSKVKSLSQCQCLSQCLSQSLSQSQSQKKVATN